MEEKTRSLSVQIHPLDMKDAHEKQSMYRISKHVHI